MDFFIAGAQKSGTTALHSYLAEHPGICMAEPKEVHYFDNEDLYRNGTPDDAIYHAHFNPDNTDQIRGEATPIYMYWNECPARMHAYNPSAKIIVILRNPITRAYSQWNMQFQRGDETRGFSEALLNEEECQQSAPGCQHRVYSYVDRGFYTRQIRRLWELFGRERVLVLRMDDLRQSPQRVLDAVCDFLEVTRMVLTTPREVHTIPYTSAMSWGEWEKLRDIFHDEISGVEAMLAWDCKEWLTSCREI